MLWDVLIAKQTTVTKTQQQKTQLPKNTRQKLNNLGQTTEY